MRELPYPLMPPPVMQSGYSLSHLGPLPAPFFTHSVTTSMAVAVELAPQPFSGAQNDTAPVASNLMA